MGRLTIRPGEPKKIGRKIEASIEREKTFPDIETDYELIEGHYYVVRDGWGKIVVVRATREFVGRNPMFVLAPGEDGHVGHTQLLILLDLGTEAP
jgi:hypothetical protein